MEYARAAKSLLDNVAKLTIRQQNGDSPRLLQAACSPSVSASVPVEARVTRFRQELLASRINLPELRRLASNGIPDKDGLRAITWKLLLGYLPPDPSEWDEVLARRRTQYFMFCEELIVDPKQAAEADSAPEDPLDAAPPSSSGSSAVAVSSSPLADGLSRIASAVAREVHGRDASDHPLSLQQTSRWHTFFKDSEIMEQIDRDVMRTHPDMHFFSGDTTEAELHRCEMKRCLFMFAKLNPGLRYIQGMNELLAPLYYMFKTDPDTVSSRFAEADAFYCFVDLLSEFRDHFCQQLDNSASGIKATIARLVQLLRHHDAPLAEHLERNKVDPHMFAFRWITLLLTQEFPFPDAVRIWDTLLSDPAGRADCLLRICLALLINVREKLLAGDFAQNVKMLQRYPSVDVTHVLRMAAQLPACKDVLGS